jgi:hypothetical protein
VADTADSTMHEDMIRSGQRGAFKTLIKLGTKVASHGSYVAFQMAELAIPRILFADILRLVSELRPPPAVAST